MTIQLFTITRWLRETTVQIIDSFIYNSISSQNHPKVPNCRQEDVPVKEIFGRGDVSISFEGIPRTTFVGSKRHVSRIQGFWKKSINQIWSNG